MSIVAKFNATQEAIDLAEEISSHVRNHGADVDWIASVIDSRMGHATELRQRLADAEAALQAERDCTLRQQRQLNRVGSPAR